MKAGDVVIFVGSGDGVHDEVDETVYEGCADAERRARSQTAARGRIMPLSLDEVVFPAVGVEGVVMIREGW